MGANILHLAHKVGEVAAKRRERGHVRSQYPLRRFAPASPTSWAKADMGIHALCSTYRAWPGRDDWGGAQCGLV
jgi:hypothetical protein